MIWGFKTVSILDVWTFEHFLSGISIGALAVRCNMKIFKNKLDLDGQDIKTPYFDLIFVLMVAYAWETVEHYLEIGLMGDVVANWFQGVEFWANRIFSDPLITLVGYYIAKGKPKLITPARVVSLIWLLVHVFIFPHSMYLHEVFKH
tara:strand:+ start:191 stop:631 length:441 start_codon:yes stop_codon:yes gene_type:complete